MSRHLEWLLIGWSLPSFCRGGRAVARVIQKPVLAEFPRLASRRGTSLAVEANAYITGSVNEDLLRRIEYLLEPSSILPFVDDEERKRSLWFRGDGRLMDWAVEPWQSHSGRLAVLHHGKMPRDRCLQADPIMRQEHRERRT